MEAFQNKFKQETGKAWEFQNARLEHDYVDYVHSQESNDPDFIKDKTIDDVNENFGRFLKRIVVQRHGKNLDAGHSIQ